VIAKFAEEIRRNAGLFGLDGPQGQAGRWHSSARP
jgi:hypothetical protein